MTHAILLTLSLMACPKPLIINNTPTWAPSDKAALKRAAVGCKAYYPDAPCVKTFTKVSELNYRVVCGT